MDRWRDRSLRVTAVLLLTSAVLILPGLAGLSGTVGLAVVLAVLSGILFVARQRIANLPGVADSVPSRYLTDIWLAPLLGALAIAAVSGASPGELQTLGGIAGLLGMANYFIRPVYLFGISFVVPQRG